MTDEPQFPPRWLPPVAEEPPPEPTEPPTVPIWAPFAALFAVIAVVSMVGAVILGLLTANDPSIEEFKDAPDAARIGLTLFQDVVFVFAAWITIRLALGAAPPEAFGLRRVVSVARALGWAAAVYAGFWIVAAGLTAIFGQPDDQALVSDIRDEDALAALIGWAILICVLAPIVEAIYFRGFMFRVLAVRLGAIWAALIVGVVFGITHYDQQAEAIQLIALGAFGIGLCILYWRTQSIIPCMALHALNNSITFGVITEPDPAVFAGIVVLSVGAVVAGATAVSARAKVAA